MTPENAPEMPPDQPKFRAWTCRCGKVVSGTLTLKDYFVEMMAHVVRTCPLVSKERGRKIMAMVNRDNLGEFDSNDAGEGRET